MQVSSGIPTIDIDTYPQFEVGGTQYYRGGIYRYVRCVSSSVAASVGALVYFVDTTCKVVTTDESESVVPGSGVSVAGAWCSLDESNAGTYFDDKHWAWILVSGITSVLADEDVVAGDIVYGGTTDGTILPYRAWHDAFVAHLADPEEPAPSPEYPPYTCGIALSDYADGYALVRLVGLV